MRSRPANALTSISSVERGRWKFVTSASTCAEAVAGPDEEAGLARPRADGPSSVARRTPACAPRWCRPRPRGRLARGPRSRRGGRLRNVEALRVHVVLVEVLVAHRQEGARARHPASRGPLDARASSAANRSREVQPRRRRGDGARARARRWSGSARRPPRRARGVMYGGSGNDRRGPARLSSEAPGRLEAHPLLAPPECRHHLRAQPARECERTAGLQPLAGLPQADPIYRLQGAPQRRVR